MTITGFVEGEPKPMGSHRAFVTGKNTSNPRAVMVNDNRGTAPWQDSVRWAFRQAYSGEPTRGGATVMLRFYFPHNKGHFGTGKNSSRLKDSAPVDMTTKPDVDKLARAVLDCGTNILWADDCQVDALTSMKDYGSRVGMFYEIKLSDKVRTVADRIAELEAEDECG